MNSSKKVILLTTVVIVMMIIIGFFYELPSDYVFDPKSGRLFWCPEGENNCDPPSWK